MNDDKRLLFTTFKFNEGLNLAIRRGVQTASLFSTGDTLRLQHRDGGEPRKAKIVSVRVKRFRDIREEELKVEHDPQCQNWNALFTTMKKLYDDFDVTEIVSMIYFTVAEE